MQLPQIRMQSQHAEIQIHTTNAKQRIEQPKADLVIHQPQAQISIQTTPAMLDIDQSKAWEDMNLMSILKRNERHAEEGMRAIAQGTARRASEGTELMKIENGGSPLINQAIRNGHDQSKSLGIKFIPSPFAVKFNYQPAEVHIDVEINQPTIEATPNKPIMTYQPGKVETSLKQREDLQISFTNLEQ
ncbi:DUF6470 family protein [Oceanobacillus chungangensis]|uniref:YviE n=1 Tax=Oceanobacillus chungangensis TaxID=1229152 RepID=A0A3D8PJL6_9BACI|nr:DUF6470 family protein [Oceanobacillus chungangensis]RDW15667.1 hypothetical protein CWR45_18005 [Oceanobacillus chungangensis]